jgi:RecG-like helicase
MNPTKVSRQTLSALTDLPNIGKAGENDLRILGINNVQDLIGQCPYQMYERLCLQTQAAHDPCVIDVFISIVRFMQGEAPQPWWAFTAERKIYLSKRENNFN